MQSIAIGHRLLNICSEIILIVCKESYMSISQAVIGVSQHLVKSLNISLKGVDAVQWVFLLVLRCWLAKVFFLSGLTKIQSWETTLMLFEYEYAVPLISPYLAAVMATSAELIIPVLLVVGFFTRLNIIALFVLNLVAAISYPDISPAGEKDHLMWGLACLMIFVSGPGVAAIDYFIRKWWIDSPVSAEPRSHASISH